MGKRGEGWFILQMVLFGVILLTPFPKPIEGGSLVTHGVYAVVRHPIYAGLIQGTLGY